MRKIFVLLLATCAASPAFADWTGKDATGATITFKNPNVCTSVVCVPISSLVDATGAAVGTAGAPLRIDPTGTTTQPVSAASLPLPAGAATSANQSTEITALNSIVTNTAAAIPAGTSRIGYVSDDPCSQATKLGASISLTASGQVLAGTAAKKTYICSLDIVSATAQNIALVEGTGVVCATNIFGLAGGTTAATGWNLPANGGLTKGAGSGTVYSPSADANGTAANVCLLLSGVGQTSGQITYVQQ